jgi:hypothetical protein
MWREMYGISGAGGLNAMFLSTTAAGHISRKLFAEYCDRVDGVLAGPYARFCLETVLMRGCTYLEVFQHLYKKLNTHFLSTKTAKQNAAVAALFRSEVSRDAKERFTAFMKYGTHIGSEILDPIFRICLDHLIPIFRRYVTSSSGDVWRQQGVCMDVEFLHISAVLIQNKWRVHSAKRLVFSKRRARDEERRAILHEQKLLASAAAASAAVAKKALVPEQRKSSIMIAKKTQSM